MSTERTAMEGTLVVINKQPTDVLFVMEPWGEEHVMAAGATLKVAFTGPTRGRIDVELKPGQIIVYGWTGCIFEVEEPAGGA